MDKSIFNINNEGKDESKSADFLGECAVCRRKFATTNPHLFENYSSVIIPQASANIIEQGNNSISHSYIWYHLNGLPAFKIKKRDYFIGVAHAIIDVHYKNVVYEMEYTHRKYVHFFYRMEGSPPFRILKLSKPLSLETERSVANWFDVNHIGRIAFASGFTYNSSATGREFMLGYGVGDHYSRVARFGFRTVSRLFQE